MHKVTPFLLAAALATASLGVLVTAPAHAKPPKPDLVTKKVSVALANGQVSALATVKNKGSKTSPASRATFYLSADGVRDGGDAVLGTVPVRRVKAKKGKPASAVFTVPAVATTGAYRVVVCADTARAVKERKETNNCAASSSSIQLTGTTTTPTGSVTVSATAGTGGTVATSGITGGTCATTTCTFPTAGAGTVTFTPTPASGYRFGAWSGAACNGFTNGADGKITFTKPTGNKACTATFVKQVTISWSVSGGVVAPLEGSVTATVTGGSCTANGASGTCTVDAGASIVTLTASAGLPPVLVFDSWGAASASTCTGVTSGTDSEVMTLSNVTADQGCVAAYTLLI